MERKVFTLKIDEKTGERTRNIFLRKQYDAFMRIAPERIKPEHRGNFEAYKQYFIDKANANKAGN